MIAAPVTPPRTVFKAQSVPARQAAVILLGQIAVWLGASYVGYALLIWPVRG